MSYYERNREKMLQYSKNTYHMNKKHFKEYNKRYYQKNKNHILQRMKDRYIKSNRVLLTPEQKRINKAESIRKYNRKRRESELKQQKEKVVMQIERLEVEYNEDGMIKLELTF